MIAGFFGTLKPDKALIEALVSDSKVEQNNPTVIEGDGFWSCLFSDSRQHLDPQAEIDSIVGVAADPVFVGTLEEGYRRATLTEWASGLAEKGVAFFRETVNNVCAAAVEKTSVGPLLHLISHRLGPGRIYYRIVKNGVVFSSDIRVLAKVAPTKADSMGLWSIIIYGAVPEQLTVFGEVYAVPIGQAATFKLGKDEPTYTPILQFNFINEPEADEGACLTEAKRALFAGARLVADLGTSMTISGGIDSSLFLCLMEEATGKRKQGYMCRFGPDDPEMAYAFQAAKASNTELKFFDISEDDVVWAIRYAAESAIHPFSDFSAIPVAFLLSRIADDRPDCPWIFDGNGGDDCFGVAGQEMLSGWKRMTALPGLFHSIAASLWLRLGLWKRHDSFDIVLRKFYQSSEPRAHLAPFIFGHTGMTHSDPSWFPKISNMLQATCDACIETYGSEPTYTNFYTIQLLHVCNRLWTTKSLGPAHDLGKNMLYPYLWRDVLTCMSKIPRQLKVRNGFAKWPLKRMLEDYMPHDFIYRPKAGFVPPWRRWLRREEVNRFTRETLLGGTGYITDILKEEWIERMLKHLKETDVNPPAMTLNTMWGALAIELWLQKTLG